MSSLPVYAVAGDRYTFLLTAADTDGSYAVVEAYVPPGGGTPPHIHHREDEAFQVLEGEIEFTVAGETIPVSAGGYLFGPRGIEHNFKNAGVVPVRMLITLSPAGFEQYFVEVGRRLENRSELPEPPTPEEFARLVELAPKYGVELLLPK